MKIEKDKFYQFNELTKAEMLDVSRMTLNRWERSGKIKVNRVGRKPFISGKEILKALGDEG